MSWVALGVAVFAVLRLRSVERMVAAALNHQVAINDHLLEMLKGKR